jgi:hypothetical protein
MWDRENKRKYDYRAMARKTTTRLQDHVLWNMFCIIGGESHQKWKEYINCLVKQYNNWNIEAEDKIDCSLSCVLINA